MRAVTTSSERWVAELVVTEHHFGILLYQMLSDSHIIVTILLLLTVVGVNLIFCT